jgi:hypothetical protein
MYCLFCVVLCIVCVYMCTVLLPPGGYPIAFKYIISSTILLVEISLVCKTGPHVTNPRFAISRQFWRHTQKKTRSETGKKKRTSLLKLLHCTTGVRDILSFQVPSFNLLLANQIFLRYDPSPSVSYPISLSSEFESSTYQYITKTETARPPKC